MPRAINLYAKAIHHKVPGELLYKLHFNDLLLLLMKLDITELESKLYMIIKSKSKDETKEVSASQAVNFLKGGSK